MAVTKDMMSPYQQKLVEDLELGSGTLTAGTPIEN